MTNRIKIGDRFHCLVTVAHAGGNKKGDKIWYCHCDCGNNTEVLAYNLLNGNTKSCGHLKSTFGKSQIGVNVGIHKHNNTKQLENGIWRSAEYVAWQGLKNRCFYAGNPSYNDYGGRGISVCDRWLVFGNFLEDMGPKPSSDHSIDRINVNGNYEPSNCRWATREEQRLNQRKRITRTEHEHLLRKLEKYESIFGALPENVL